MDNYLIDRETLGQFVDELIKKKPLPVDSAEELTKFREEQIAALDDRISQAIFEQLSDDQLREVNELLDDEGATAERFQEFFSNAGVDIEKVISDTLEAFSKEFLGGQNE